MSDLLLDRLLQLPREQTAVSAVRDTSGGVWAHWTWGELIVAVRRMAGVAAIASHRGERVQWSAPRGGLQLVRDLAMQFAGVVGERTDSGPDPGLDMPSGADDLGRLVRMRQDVRPRDPAAWRGRALEYAEVATLAERVAKRLGAGPVLSTSDADTEQLLGWASVWGGASLVCTDVSRRALVDPAVWVCLPEHLEGLTLEPPNALQRLGVRSRPRLERIFVVGGVPAAAASRFPGVEVAPWIA